MSQKVKFEPRERDSIITCYTAESEELDEKIAFPQKRSPSKRKSILDHSSSKKSEGSPLKPVYIQMKQPQPLSVNASNHIKTLSQQKQLNT